MSIQRWEFLTPYCDVYVGECGHPSANKDDDGDFVEHEDHLAVVAERDAKIAELEARLDNERWRSVEKDGEPSPGRYVAINAAWKHLCEIADFDGLGWQLKWPVTHYRPMPEPPKDEDLAK